MDKYITEQLTSAGPGPCLSPWQVVMQNFLRMIFFILRGTQDFLVFVFVIVIVYNNNNKNKQTRAGHKMKIVCLKKFVK